MSDKGPIEQIKELARQASLEVDLAVASHNAAVFKHKIEELEVKLAKAERALSKIAEHDLQRIAWTTLRANWLDLHACDLALVEIAKHDTQGWALTALATLKGENDD